MRRGCRVTRPDARTRESAPVGPSLARLGFFAVALLVALAAIGPLLQGWSWWLAAAGASLVPLALVAVAAGFGARARWRVLVAFGGGVGVLVVGFARDVALLGVVPTPEVAGRWGDLVSAGARDIAGQRVPATATEGIVFLLVVLAVVAAVAGAPLLDRAPALAVGPLLAVFAVPVLTRPGLVEPLWPVLALLAVLGLLRVGRRRAAATGVAVLAVAATVGALAFPAVFPEGGDPRGPLRGGFALNPIIALGDDLRRDSIETALTYRTDSGEGVYLRLATLDDVGGLTWEPDTSLDADTPLDEAPAPRGLGADVATRAASVEIRIADVGGSWLPVPYPATAVSGLRGTWRWALDSLTVGAYGASLQNQEYVAQFLDVEPTPAQLASTRTPRVPARFLALPDEMPPVIEQTAREVVGDAATPLASAVRLQEFFTGGAFDYSLEAPVEGDYDGSGVDVIARFLDERAGYCVHFASAMAVMARTLDIPARVVVGFQPGEPVAGEPGVFEVLSSDLHAWPELYIEGVGWLRFEPTPGRGSTPGYAAPEVVDDVEVPEAEGPGATAEPVDPPTAPEPSVPDDAPAEPTEAVQVAASPVGAVVGTLGLAALALLTLPATVRLARRLRRLRRVDGGDAVAAWAEIRDTAIDHGFGAPDSESPRALVARIPEAAAAGVLTDLRVDVERVAYGPPGAGRLRADDVRAATADLARAAGWRARILAIVAPASLLPSVTRVPRD